MNIKQGQGGVRVRGEESVEGVVGQNQNLQVENPLKMPDAYEGDEVFANV